MKTSALQISVTKIDTLRTEIYELEGKLQNEQDLEEMEWLENEIAANEVLINKEYKKLVATCIKQGKLTVADFDFVSETMIDEESLECAIQQKMA